jgi:catechol 2,3-dioxygenase-like lactoylglutathione lyase family enzyme
MKILRLDHVQLAIPPGAESAARSFYSGILGLEEVPKPTALTNRGGCWFKSGDVQIHTGIEEDFRPAKKAHPALVVENLDVIVARCRAAGLPTKPDADFSGFRRVHIFDPFGNRIELMEAVKA